MKDKCQIKYRTIKNTFISIFIILNFFQAKAQTEQILMSDFM